ncbi:MAG: UDP-N-acetylmuramate--L-alanine ligase [Oscillospiraceae bacterium]
MLEGKKHIHFIGIGGSGMAPLAEILHDKGYYLTGSDNNPSDTLDHIKSLGIPVFMGQSAKNIQGADLIVHTAAIMSDNEELIAAKNSGVPVLERSELFGIISKQYSNAVCVCGTHGKTTTTAMLTQIVLDAGLDPTAVIGGKLASINGNGRVGKSDLMVCEACEFVDTFLKLYPDTCIMLNIEEDHMDYFKTMDNLIKSFNKFASMATKKIIANGDDPEVYLALKGIEKPIITFGYTDKNDYYSENIVFHKGIHTSFDFMHNGKKIDTVDLYVPGRHNVLNATAVIAAAIDLGIPFEKIKSGMKNFKGAGRRFEVLGVKNGVTYVDDYAHHPAEIKVTLEAAKSMGFKRVIAVHQPFTFSRTKMHLDYFAQVLSIADKVVLSPIMGSREKNTYDIKSEDLANKIENATVLDSFEDISNYVNSFAKEGDMVITLGCGDIYKAAKLMLK